LRKIIDKIEKSSKEAMHFKRDITTEVNKALEKQITKLKDDWMKEMEVNIDKSLKKDLK